jgi:hypothetical protein
MRQRSPYTSDQHRGRAASIGQAMVNRNTGVAALPRGRVRQARRRAYGGRAAYRWCTAQRWHFATRL